ncbi:hypothetical protein ACRALDRAFT_2022855 [Sodiomyces alcalophilus JCM 7366]|uniref:uncharacterized protein n=1 Tax=Sodiomyces alcalophilus JCM 7366 TaxID=591952 RepID=UPI0039B419CD
MDADRRIPDCEREVSLSSREGSESLVHQLQRLSIDSYVVGISHVYYFSHIALQPDNSPVPGQTNEQAQPYHPGSLFTGIIYCPSSQSSFVVRLGPRLYFALWVTRERNGRRESKLGTAKELSNSSAEVIKESLAPDGSNFSVPGGSDAITPTEQASPRNSAVQLQLPRRTSSCGPPSAELRQVVAFRVDQGNRNHPEWLEWVVVKWETSPGSGLIRALVPNPWTIRSRVDGDALPRFGRVG